MRAGGVIALSLLLLTGCGGPSEVTTTSPTPTNEVAALPQLEAGQSDEELARDFLDALNVWFHAGKDEVADQWSPSDGKDALVELTRTVAEKHYDEYAEALLVDDFDQQRGGAERYMTSDDFVSSHAEVLYTSTDGHINNKGEPTEGYDVLYEFNGLVEAEEMDGSRVLTMSATAISDPYNPDFESSPGKHRVTLRTEGDVMKVEAAQ